jgi:intracellular sulfur oxidation DsrE/DsrF family protein
MQAQRNDFQGLPQARAVWDFTTGDERRFLDRISLMQQTLQSFRDRGIATDFVMLIHGPATKFVARSHAGTKFSDDVPRKLDEIQSVLKQLSDAGTCIEVCLIAMERCLVGADNVLPFAMVEPNVFLNSIALQNKGYAYMWMD